MRGRRYRRVRHDCRRQTRRAASDAGGAAGPRRQRCETVNVPSDIAFAEFAATYRRAYALGLKGCTVYRPNTVTGAVLSASPTAERCCELPGA
jgi:hypothetical protein